MQSAVLEAAARRALLEADVDPAGSLAPNASAQRAVAPETSTPVKDNSISEQTVPVRTSASCAQIRRLPPLAKRAVLAQQTMQDCCEGKCGMENPQRIVGNIARAAQEVINGARPITQLMRWLTADTYDAIRRRLSVQARSARPARRAVTVTSCHICRINHDTVEGTVVLSDGGRVRAAVVRLEAFRGRWRASYLQTI